MRRHTLAALACLALAPAGRAAEIFDHYTNPVLARATEAKEAKEVKQLTRALVVANDRVLPKGRSAFLIVKTNGGRYAKLLVQMARQKVDAERAVPMLLIDRYVTYKEGEERTVQAEGRNLALFPGFRLSLDLGQVVPAELGGDLRLVADGDKLYAEPLGQARLYLLTKALPDVVPKKGPKFVAGEAFEPAWFNGTYHLRDDGRRSGRLTLKVDDDGAVTGSFYSDKDGAKYDVHGRVGTPRHSVQFTIKYPRSEETFTGFLFTGDGMALAGTSRLQEREAGFYAPRVEE